MITVYKANVNQVDAESYKKFIDSLNLYSLICPKCKHHDFQKHGYYTRKVKYRRHSCVENFANKILLLTDGNKDKMKSLVNHSRKGTAFKTDQNFYYLWLILKNIDISIIEKEKNTIFEIIRLKFKDIQSFKGKVDVQTLNNLFDSID